MIDRKTAIEELNNNITFISSNFIDSHPETCDMLEENHAFDDYMCTAGEVITLLREMDIIKNHITDTINILTYELSKTENSNREEYIKGQLSAFNEILDMID